MEQQIKIAAKIYQCRDLAKRLYRERFPEKMKEYQEYIRAYMAKHGVSELLAVMGLLKLVDAEGMTAINLLAAVAEMLEPSTLNPLTNGK